MARCKTSWAAALLRARVRTVSKKVVALWHGAEKLSQLPSGKHTKNYGKSPFLMGNSTISMAIFNSYVSLPEGSLFFIKTTRPGKRTKIMNWKDPPFSIHG